MDYSKEDDVRKQILDAAKTIFQKWGLFKSTMEDIAREAGKGKSTLYYYFKSKEEIFDIVASAEFNHVIAIARENIKGIESAKEKLRTYIVTSLTTYKQHFTPFSIVREEIKGNRNLIDKLIKQMIEEEEIFIKEILSEGVKTKEFSFVNEKELNVAAKVITGIINAMELYLLLDNDDIEQIDVAAKFIANGI